MRLLEYPGLRAPLERERRGAFHGDPRTGGDEVRVWEIGRAKGCEGIVAETESEGSGLFDLVVEEDSGGGDQKLRGATTGHSYSQSKCISATEEAVSRKPQVEMMRDEQELWKGKDS